MKDLTTIKRIWRYFGYILSKRQKWQLLGVMILVLLGSLTELLGVSIILPFIQAFLTPEIIMDKWYVRILQGMLRIADTQTLLFWLGILIVAVYVFKNVFLSFVAYVRSRFDSALQRSLAVEMLQSYLDRSYSFFVKSNTGDLLRGVNTDTLGVHNFIMTFFKFVAEALAVFFIFLYLAGQDLMLAIATMLLAGFCSGIITLFVKKRINLLTTRSRTAAAKRAGAEVQIINNIKDLLVFDKTRFFMDQYEEDYRVYADAQANTEFIRTLPERIIEATCISGIILFIVIRIRMGAESMAFISTMSVFAMGAFKILPSIAHIAGYTQVFIKNRPMVEETYKNLKEAREYLSGLERTQSDRDKESPQFCDRIRIEDIVWQYENSKEPVLNGLSMEIRKGEMIGIIGESGAGKSTLGDLILGLYVPQSGKIRMDETDIVTIPATWRKSIAYVPQMLLLFAESIRFNITFSNNTSEDDRIWEILREASMEEFVRSLPDGLDTLVGDRGIKLSGGQRQRIAIARALFAGPQILLLDEATSALDSETEEAVVESINLLSHKMTLIVIAHRLTTLRSCDRIYRIEDGKASEVKKTELGI
ncbi:MAG: ABC transporter ATP-binding protein/permease [Lachnospiraceae bacterium]|nr:ABC transporter ATP-binding protein/permease [Lachnospiraceae bacterium]